MDIGLNLSSKIRHKDGMKTYVIPITLNSSLDLVRGESSILSEHGQWLTVFVGRNKIFKTKYNNYFAKNDDILIL